jgi:hypothetical protein
VVCGSAQLGPAAAQGREEAAGRHARECRGSGTRLNRDAAREFVPRAPRTPKTERRRTPVESRWRTEQLGPDGLRGGLGAGPPGWGAGLRPEILRELV